MIFQAHRGVSTEYPENTMPAFCAAFEQGYPIIETDPVFTVDGFCVLFHDKTIARTCRNADGSLILEDRKVAEMTYDELVSLDAGLFAGEQFRGTHVPLLEEVLAYAAEKKLHVKLDNKFEKFTLEQKMVMFDIVKKSGADVGFTCSGAENISLVAEHFANAVIHYDGCVDEASVKEVKAILKNNPLVVWLALPSHLTEWVKCPTASAELCQMVKQYGKLGLWILETEEQLERARLLGADIIETTGSLKPKTSPEPLSTAEYLCCKRRFSE